MRFNFLVIFVLLKIEINAQAILNESYQLRTHENSLGFAGFNTFNTCVSQSVTYPLSYGGGNGCIRLLGVNNDGTIRFNKTLGSNGVFDLTRMSTMPFKKRTRGKGMMFVLYGWHCSSNNRYNVSCYAKLDSMGNTVFSQVFYSYGNAIDTISNNFYFISDYSKISRIDPLTGVITNSIFSTSQNGAISAASVTSKKQIIIGTTNSILIVDTLGNLINSKPASFVNKKILNIKSDFLFLNSNSNVIEKRDSALQIIATYACGSNFQINDLDFFNDTVYLALYNTSNKTSQIISLDNSLNVIQIKNVNNTYQSIKGIQKDDKVKIIMNDYTGPIGNFLDLSSDDFASTGFAVFNSINDIQFDNDLVITNVTNLSCATVSLSYNTYLQRAYTYQNKVTIYNNSPNVVNNFNLNHPIPTFMPGSSQACYSSQNFGMYSQNYSLSINPYQSVDVILPQLTDYYTTPYGDVLDLKFIYNVNSPNGKTESNTSNSTYSQIIHFDFRIPQLSDLVLFPNPAEIFLNLNSKVGLTKYLIHDLLGHKVMESDDFSTIDISILTAGLYFITIEKDKEKVVKKFLKK